MKKKVAIVINSAWYAHIVRRNLAFEIKKNGYIVIFIAPEDNIYSQKLRDDFDFFNLEIDAKGINPFNDLKTIYQMYRLYKKLDIDLVLNFTIKPNIYSSIVCGLLNKRCISNITGLGTIFISESFITKLAKLLYKIALNNNQKVFFQNPDDKGLFIQNRLVKNFKTDILPGSGVDINKFVPKKENKKSNKFVFLMISRLLKDKGVLELIESVRILKKKYSNFEVQLLGSSVVENNTSISKENLNNWINEGLVNHLGMKADVRDFISNSDCVLLPSYREGTPRSLLEAAAMGKPIITTNVVGCKEVVIDGLNGFLCEVKNSEDLASKMEQMMLLDKNELLKMGKEGRKKIVNEFDEKIVINKYLDSIQELLK